MVKAQDFINMMFPNKEQREKVKTLSISNKTRSRQASSNLDKIGEEYYFYDTQLIGELNLNDFINLEKLYILGDDNSKFKHRKQQITELKIGDCVNLKDLKLNYLGENFKIDRSIAFTIVTQPKIWEISNQNQTPSSLRRLTNLSIKHCSELTELSWLSQLTELEDFTISHCPHIANLDLTENRKLTQFNCSFSDRLKKIKGLESLVAGLEKFDVNFCPQLVLKISVDDIDRLSNLTQFTGCSKLKDEIDEIKKAKMKDLISQIKNKKTELEKLTDDIRNKGATSNKIDSLLQKQREIVEMYAEDDPSTWESLEVHQAEIWKVTGDEKEVQKICKIQIKIVKLERELREFQQKLENEVAEQFNQLQINSLPKV